MKEDITSNTNNLPELNLSNPTKFWQFMRQIVREEIISAIENKHRSNTFNTPGLTYKPLFKIAEVCILFNITKPTIYEWVRHGKLKPIKIRSRVFFLWQDIQQLLQEKDDNQE